MAFQYLTNTELSRAVAEYTDTLLKAGYQASAETIPVQHAAGRITARAVYAHISAPHYPASAMDGIAVRASDTFGATETTPVTLPPDSFLVVDTGDLIPEKYDAVIMVEDLVHLADGAVRIHASAAPWQHIRQIGEDICAGEMVLPGHTRITPAAIGAFLAAGILSVEVLRRPVVGIIPTGDEIVAPTENPGPGDIIEFNSSIFSAMVTEWGAVPKVFPIVKDRFDDIKNTLDEALEACDIVLLNAGSSAGREDFSAEAIGTAGSVLFHGIAIKPGKPAILGYRDNKPILGVPGYPVSGIIVLEQILKPLLDVWFAAAKEESETISALLSRPVVSGLKYREFVRVRLGRVGDRMIASPLNRGSGVVTSFVKADGLLEVPQNLEGYEAGSEVQVHLLRPKQELDNILVAIGSHDPLLDEIGDLLHRADPSMFMSSSHVGSMGGIMAVKRGETHIAGTHLLDEADGTYNYSYIKKFFPQGGVHLIECVGRTQGLMLAKGNPKEIRSLKDLTAPGIRYVNRQKGSGTRVLMDYLCRKEGIPAESIYGYDREEFTHMSVAVQIASGTADAGMGIYSAAKNYGLDFLPICMEQYDLLIPDAVWNTPVVRKLIEILKSDDFRQRALALGGYELKNPGTERLIP